MRSNLDKYMRGAIEELLRQSYKCSSDNFGFIQGLPMKQVAMLHKQFDKYLRKHGKRPVRPEVAA
jgi:hypothetical protein